MVNLSRLENKLNDYFKYDDECMTFKLLKIKDNIIMQVYEADTDELLYTYEHKASETMLQIIKDFIWEIYEKSVNWRQRYINGWKAYTRRKVKSLAIWTRRNNVERIEQINKELIERYKVTEHYKNEVFYYKHIVSALYYAKRELCPESEAA